MKSTIRRSAHEVKPPRLSCVRSRVVLANCGDALLTHLFELDEDDTFVGIGRFDNLLVAPAYPEWSAGEPKFLKVNSLGLIEYIHDFVLTFGQDVQARAPGNPILADAAISSSAALRHKQQRLRRPAIATDEKRARSLLSRCTESSTRFVASVRRDLA